MRNIFVACVLSFLPMTALAHTKWFADETLVPFSTAEPTTFYLGVWAIVIAVIVGIGAWLERQHWCSASFMEPKKPHVFERAASTFVMVAGAFFVIAGTHEYLFSPNLTVDSGIPMYLVTLEILIGLAFLLGIASRLAGIVLGLMWFASFFYIGWVEAIEDIWVLSTAVFIILMGNDYFSIVTISGLRSLVAPYKHYALSLLRLGTGATLMILGLSEKIMAPEFGINFLNQYNWNFMQMLGFEFSDYLFTISAGATEFLFGLVFVLGVVTRINAAVVAVVFTIPLFILGPIELAGHLPHFAAVVLLLLFGNGGHFALFNDKKYC